MSIERPKRRRDSLLEALHILKGIDAGITVHQIMAFLYICENEGLSVQELCVATGFSQSSASRVSRALGPPASDWSHPPAMGLVEAFLNPSDGRSHVMHLSEKGRRLRDQLDDVIERAVRIAPANFRPAKSMQA